MRRVTIRQMPGGASQAAMQNAGLNAPQGVFGLWGKVLARHSEDHTVDIRTDREFVLERVPVASREWITESDPPTGARDLPPEGTYVFMLMPTGQVESGFIIASVFPQTLAALKTDFLKKDKESEAFTRREGGWQKTYDKSNGNLLVEDDDGFTLHVKKSGKEVTITDWNKNKATINGSGVKLEDGNGNVITTNAKGINIKDKSGNEIDLAPTGTTAKTVNGRVTGGMVRVTGTAAPTGSGPFCAIAVCPFTGQPHVGDTVVGT